MPPTGPTEEPTLASSLDGVANMLLVAPAGAPAADDACIDFLSTAGPPGQDVLVVSFSWSPDRWLDAWQDRTGTGRPASLGFIAAGEEARAAAASSAEPSATPAPVRVVPVSNPGNLTDVGAAVSDLLSAWADDGRPVAVCLRSVHDLLAHADRQVVFRFLHVLTGLLQTTGAVGHYHLDPDRAGASALRELTPLFDAVVALEGGEWQVRVDRPSAGPDG